MKNPWPMSSAENWDYNHALVVQRIGRGIAVPVIKVRFLTRAQS